MPTAPKPPNRRTPPLPPSDAASPAEDAQVEGLPVEDAQAAAVDTEQSTPADEQDAIASDVDAVSDEASDTAAEPETVEPTVIEVASDPVEPVAAPAVEPVAIETEPVAKPVHAQRAGKQADEPAAPVAPPVPELSASQVLQHRMGLGKLIADRLAEKLSDEEQQALSRAHAEQDFDEYSRLVALIQYRPKASA